VKFQPSTLQVEAMASKKATPLRLLGTALACAFVFPFAASANPTLKNGIKSAEAPRIIDAGTIWHFDFVSVPTSKQVRKGKTLLALPLFPDKLIEIESDVMDVGTTGVKMSAGKQFFAQRLANGKEVFCSSRTLDWMKDGGSIFYGRKGGTFSCLVDRDFDGLLDGEYEVLTRTESGVPFITHGKDNGYEAIKPVRYKFVDRKTFNHPLTFELKWCCGNGIDNNAIFTASVKDDQGEYVAIQGGFGAPQMAVPGQFEFAGINISISSPAKKVLDVKFGNHPTAPVFVTEGMSIFIGEKQ
jgi:hypothetical protein